MHLQSIHKPSGFYGGAGNFGFSSDAYLNEKSALISDPNRHRLFSDWSNYWNLEKPYLLEKSPPNLIRTRYLQAMFPKSYFVVLMRHPLAVSYATRAWYKNYGIYWRKLSKILKHWLVCHEQMMEDITFLNNVIILKYENFVAQPELNLKKIYRFLDLDYYPLEQKVFSDINKKYFSMWEKRSKKYFGRFSVRHLISKYENRVNKFEYSLMLNNLARLDHEINP